MSGFTVRSFSPRTTEGSGSVLGYAKVATPAGIVIHDVIIRKKDGIVFAAPCKRAVVDALGHVIIDGKQVWVPTISFDSIALRARFSDAVIAALRVSNPELFQ
jgi:hypothetical protein